MNYDFASASLYKEAASIKKRNPQLYKELVELAKDAAKDPSYFSRCGREPRNGRKGDYESEFLRHEKKYSCKTSKGDRLVYRVEGGVFMIYNLTGHYESLNSATAQLWDSSLDQAFAY